MPTPNKNETQKDFINRCIPYVLKDGTAKDEKQAAAICHSLWRKRHSDSRNTYKVVNSGG